MPRGSKTFEHGRVAYYIDGDGEQNIMQVKFHPMVKLVTFGSGNFKDSYTKLYVCSHKLKIENTLNGIFILSPGSCPRGRT